MNSQILQETLQQETLLAGNVVETVVALTTVLRNLEDQSIFGLTTVEIFVERLMVFEVSVSEKCLGSNCRWPEFSRM